MEKRHRTLQNSVVFLWIIVFAAILLTHSFIIAHAIRNQNRMASEVLDNKRDYSMLILLAASSGMMPVNELKLFNNLHHYEFRLENYKIDLNFTENPKWPVTIKGKLNKSIIYNSIKKDNGKVQLSYLMKNGQWLNYSEQPAHSSYDLMIFMFALEFFLLCFLVFYGWSLYRLKLPLKDFKRSANRLGVDINITPANEKGPMLVRETASAMNKMQERIQELVKNRTKILATISHDLKTPITRIKLRTQFMEDRDAAVKIEHDLDEMQAMISGVLSYASNDMIQEQKVSFDMISFIYTIVDEFLDLGYIITINSSIHNHAVTARKLAMKRCISNIITNGKKYAKTMEISIDVVDGQLQILIEDDGPGIPDDEIDQVFEPFYRSKGTQFHSSTGSGLGLTMAYEVIKAHDGVIKLENRQPNGLRVIIIL